MSQTKELFSVEYHYDTDTGMYAVGEIDHAICGELDQYLKFFGSKGRANLIKHMGFLMYDIECRFRKNNQEPQGYCG